MLGAELGVSSAFEVEAGGVEDSPVEQGVEERRIAESDNGELERNKLAAVWGMGEELGDGVGARNKLFIFTIKV